MKQVCSGRNTASYRVIPPTPVSAQEREQILKSLLVKSDSYCRQAVEKVLEEDKKKAGNAS